MWLHQSSRADGVVSSTGGDPFTLIVVLKRVLNDGIIQVVGGRCVCCVDGVVDGGLKPPDASEPAFARQRVCANVALAYGGCVAQNEPALCPL